MLNVGHLLQRVESCGYTVRVTADGAAVLVPTRGECVMPAPLLKALKDHKAAVVAYLTECVVCKRDVRDPEDRERLREVNPFCDRGYAREATDADGVRRAASTPCPFRTDSRRSTS